MFMIATANELTDPPTMPSWVGVTATAIKTATGNADAVRERVFVEAPMDSDRDGHRDRIAVDIIRPAESGSTLTPSSTALARMGRKRPKMRASRESPPAMRARSFRRIVSAPRR